jgi:hypothetical protein
MTKDRYRWHFTFKINPVDEITVEEGHPDLDFLKDLPDSYLVAATLVDVDRFSLFDEEEKQVQAVIHSLSLEPSKLIRVFRRVEMNITIAEKRTIPAFQYRSDKDHYCFAFMDIMILTDDSKFSRNEWGDE